MLLVADIQDEQKIGDVDALAKAKGLEKLSIERSKIQAVTHVDHSARVQTGDHERHPLYHALIKEFDKITGCPVLINTSFNVRGEPIVNTPEDAYFCFMATNMDVLVMGRHILLKKDQDDFDEKQLEEHLSKFALD
jgi:carbamoyltransferase